MFKVLPISFHTGVQPSMPLVDCLVDNMQLQRRPCSSQVPLQISNVKYGHAVDTLLHDATDFIVHWIQVGTTIFTGHSVLHELGQKYHGVMSIVVVVSWKLLQGTVGTYKTRCGGRCDVFVSNVLWYVSAKNWQNPMKSYRHHKNIKSDIYLKQCIYRYSLAVEVKD